MTAKVRLQSKSNNEDTCQLMDLTFHRNILHWFLESRHKTHAVHSYTTDYRKWKGVEGKVCSFVYQIR